MWINKNCTSNKMTECNTPRLRAVATTLVLLKQCTICILWLNFSFPLLWSLLSCFLCLTDYRFWEVTSLYEVIYKFLWGFLECTQWSILYNNFISLKHFSSKIFSLYYTSDINWILLLYIICIVTRVSKKPSNL